MAWWEWKSRREASRPVLTHGWMTGWPGLIGEEAGAAIPPRYADQVRAAFEQNPLAQRACRLITSALAGAPLLIRQPLSDRASTGAGDAATEALGARIGALIGARSGGQALIETVALHLLLHGNAYVQVIESADGDVGELFALRPDKVTIEIDGEGWPIAYAYGVGEGRRRLSAEDARGRAAIVHIRAAHPIDDHYGLGCLSAAIGAVMLHNQASRWNRALMANAARPSGALVHESADKGASLTATQFERLKAEMAEQFQGAANAGRPMLLDGGLRWQALSLSPAEMDFVALKDSAARDIACAFGVPPMLLGIPGDATYANYREAMKALWRDVVLPLGTTILTALGEGLAGWGLGARLWNYAVGSAEDAAIRLDFSALDGGFLLPVEADPVWAGDVDRMFISLVPPDYDVAGAPYAAPVEGWVELSAIACDGSASVLAIGDALVPEGRYGIATGYDDAYNQTPERLWRQIEALGYVGPLLHYVGMSHFPALAHGPDGWRAGGAGAVLCGPARAWHAALAAGAAARGRTIIWSLSYELLADFCPEAWMQRDGAGAPALTGYAPPSTLLSPAHGAAMAWLGRVGAAFVTIGLEAGLAPLFQIGEPWWWVAEGADGKRRLCAYDAATGAALAGASVAIDDLRAPLSSEQTAMLDALGVLLAQSTAALAAAVRAAAPGVRLHLLSYLPGVLDPAMPEVRRANLPPGWAYPAFDVVQIEDYDWASRGQTGLSEAGIAAATARLGYGVGAQHYLSGFVARAEDSAQWGAIHAAAVRAERRGVAATYVWALPQVARDGFTHWPEEDAMQAFDDIAFPIALGREASVSAEFSTAIVTAQSGAEQRAPEWDDARLRFDVGPGIRSEEDVAALVAFYRARRGPAAAFRFRDPIDHASAAAGELLGVGDGVATDFALVRHYGAGTDAVARRITRPDAASVTVEVDGAAASGWVLAAGGVVRFAVPPAVGAAVRARFAFDVPVRFAEDRLEVSRATFLAGHVASVPLIEVREG